ncbi:MAG: hypothetical protein WKF41_10320 [Gaiellaceae bacterium]
MATAGVTEPAHPSTYLPFGIHLAGSIPLPSADDVLRTVSEAVGDKVRRIPDGEIVADRLQLMLEALEVIFGGRKTFLACRTSIGARKP